MFFSTKIYKMQGNNVQRLNNTKGVMKTTLNQLHILTEINLVNLCKNEPYISVIT